MKKPSESGFTLVEMLVVVAIIGLLMGVMAGGYSVVLNLAWQARSQELVSNVATALNIYIQREGSWPDKLLESKGQVNNEVCKILQEAKLLDVTTVANADQKDGTKKGEIDKKSLQRFGLFSPWGQRLIRGAPDKGATLGTVPVEFEKHIVQFRVDLNLDGKIDSEDNMVGAGKSPSDEASIRASAIVWTCGPKGKDSGEYGARRLQDNRQSWGAGK